MELDNRRTIGDPVTFVGVAVVVVVVAVLAVLIPTVRIFRLNPIDALRSS